MQELYDKIFINIQSLLIYELGNKNRLKNINDQNFAHFMRGYDKGFYGNQLFSYIFNLIKTRFFMELCYENYDWNQN